MSLGFQLAGCDLVAAFENWEPAIAMYQENFSHPVHMTDLSKHEAVNEISAYSPELIIGGPPCQDFSSAGKRDESQGRADLTLSFVDIVTSVNPAFFVMENVERALKSNVMAVALQKLRDHGYGLTIRVLNASYFGVPQNRKRLFVIGELNGKENTFNKYIDELECNKPMTIRDYVGLDFGIEHYYRHPRSYMRRGVFSIDEPSPTVRGVNRPVPKGYPGHSGDTCEVTSELRPLTTKERSIIQTYPRDFKLIGTKTNVEQIVGNAVPVNLAKSVALSVLNYASVKIEESYNCMQDVCA